MFDVNNVVLPYSKQIAKYADGIVILSHNSMYNWEALGAILGFTIVCCIMYDTNDFLNRFKPRYVYLFTLLVMAIYSITRFTKASEFIYFQF